MCETHHPIHPWWDARRPRGFRFSLWDAAIVVAMAMLTWWLWLSVGLLAWLCPIVAGHFFLFCNVFRVGNRAELIWAGTMVANVFAWVLTGELDWIGVMYVQTPVTLAVIVWAMLQKDYHGLGWKFRRRCGAKSLGPDGVSNDDE